MCVSVLAERGTVHTVEPRALAALLKFWCTCVGMEAQHLDACMPSVALSLIPVRHSDAAKYIHISTRTCIYVYTYI